MHGWLVFLVERSWKEEKWKVKNQNDGGEKKKERREI